LPAIAVALRVVGIYGVLVYAAGQRRQQFVSAWLSALNSETS
jgi:hypothetical protein